MLASCSRARIVDRTHRNPVVFSMRRSGAQGLIQADTADTATPLDFEEPVQFRPFRYAGRVGFTTDTDEVCSKPPAGFGNRLGLLIEQRLGRRPERPVRGVLSMRTNPYGGSGASKVRPLERCVWPLRHRSRSPWPLAGGRTVVSAAGNFRAIRANALSSLRPEPLGQLRVPFVVR